MIIWLPRCRTCINPWSARMLQTSRPDSTRNLPNRNLQARHKDFTMEPVLDFRRVRRFKEQFDGFHQIAPRLFDCRALTCDIQFRTEGDIAIALTFDNASKMLELLHKYTHCLYAVRGL